MDTNRKPDIKVSTKMSPPNGSDQLSSLRDCISSISTLLRDFEAALKTPVACPPKNTVTNQSQNALALLSSAASILRAQTTKLSLLILNSPFTPSAITHTLNSLSTSCLPALMTALELCSPHTHSALLHNHMRTLLSRAIQAFSALLATIPQQDNERSSSITHQRRGKTLAATGMLWETCDGMTQLSSTGLSALAIEKLDTFHALLKDAIAELEEWDPSKDEDDLDTDCNPDDSDPPPSFPSQTLHLLNLTLRLQRQIRLLYPAIKKHRLSTFPPLTLLSSSPPSPAQIQTLDIVTTALADFSSAADELACALYSHDHKEVLRLLSCMREQACDCIHSVMMDWRGEEDLFSVWARKWVGMIRALDVGEEGIKEEGDKKERDSVDDLGDSSMGKEGRVELLRQQNSGGDSSSFESEIPIR